MTNALFLMLASTLLMPLQADKKPAEAPKVDSSPAHTTYSEFFLTQQPTNTFVVETPIYSYRLSKNASALEGWSKALGLSLTDVDEPLRVHLRLSPSEGLLVTGVNEKGPAARAMLQANDILLGLPAKVELHQPLNLVTVRAGQRLNFVVDATPAKQFWIGVHTAELEDALRIQLSLPAERGVLISEVTDKAPAQKAGLLKFDVIIGLADGTAIKNTDELSKLVQGSAGKPLQFQIVRHAKSMTLGITPIERPQEKAQATTDAASPKANWIYSRDASVLSDWVTARQNVVPSGDWLTTVQNHQAINLQPYWTAIATQDPSAKIDAMQKQVEQLLKEVTSLRQTLEKQKQPDNAPKK